MKNPIRVFIVEHDPMLHLLERECVGQVEGLFCCGHADSLQSMERILASPAHMHDIALLNPLLPSDTLRRTISLLRSHNPGSEIIIVSQCAGTSFIATAYRLGIFDYIIAPFPCSRLRKSLLECRNRLRLLASFPSSLTQQHIDALLYQQTQQASEPFRARSKIPDRQRMLQIMNTLSEAEAPLPLDEIVRRARISRSTVWRCLRYLEEKGFIGTRQHHEGLGRPSVHFFPMDASRSAKLFPIGNNEKKRV